MNIFNNLLFKKVLVSLITLLIALLFYSLLKKLINKIFKLQLKTINTKKQKTLQVFFTNLAKWIVIVITFLIILEIFGIDTKVIITSLGAITVVIGLAFQDMLKDFIAGISLIFENSYNVGDIITVNSFKGEVVYIGMKDTKIKANTGEVLIIHNGSIKEVINHTITNSLAIIDIGVSYDSDIEKVEKTLNDLALKLTKKIPNIKGKIKVLGIEELADSAIIFRVSAEVEANTQYQVQRELRKQIKLEFDKNNINIPYNQVVIHNE